MGDNAGASDSDNVLLADPSNSLCVAKVCAATQTPELPRHATPSALLNAAPSVTAPSTSQPSSSVLVLRVDNHNGFSNFAKEAKALAIPDVVVEYIKDSIGEELGTSNPAFEGQETILIRTPSRLSLREDYKENSASDASSLNFLHPKDQEGGSGRSDIGLLPLASHNHRMYSSMPRNAAKKHFQEDFRMHSQPSTPQLQRAKIHEGMDSSSSASLFPPRTFAIPPSPNFGYRPLESETSAVYTIIKTCMNTSAVQEIHLLPAMMLSEKTSPTMKRKFDFATSPEDVEKKRRRLQCCVDIFSTLSLMLGLFICIFAPVIIIPMLLYPFSYFILFTILFIISGIAGVVILAFSGLIGNMVWYYDEQAKKLRLRLHCGKGPMKHFWGNGFYGWSDDQQPRLQKVLEV